MEPDRGLVMMFDPRALAGIKRVTFSSTPDLTPYPSGQDPQPGDWPRFGPEAQVERDTPSVSSEPAAVECQMAAWLWAGGEPVMWWIRRLRLGERLTIEFHDVAGQ
ncbi:MAG TPA: hypothetical protein VGJ13_05295 [Pseudonocardiaceae bacterium]